MKDQKRQRRLDHGGVFHAPYSTQQRKPRDIAKEKIDGRSQEIQRLMAGMARGRDLEKTWAAHHWIDCDVLQADGARAPRPSPAATWRYRWLSGSCREQKVEAKSAPQSCRRGQCRHREPAGHAGPLLCGRRGSASGP